MEIKKGSPPNELHLVDNRAAEGVATEGVVDGPPNLSALQAVLWLIWGGGGLSY